MQGWVHERCELYRMPGGPVCPGAGRTGGQGLGQGVQSGHEVVKGLASL
jgi:hypothetical protein